MVVNNPVDTLFQFPVPADMLRRESKRIEHLPVLPVEGARGFDARFDRDSISSFSSVLAFARRCLMAS